MPKQHFGEIEPDEQGNRRCPKCGGAQFQPMRSTARKVMFGFASLLGSQNEVKCLGCGTKYKVQGAMSPAPPGRPD